MDNVDKQYMPRGYKWRSSKWFVLSTIAIAVFSETFLYGFLAPILGYILRDRINVQPSKTQEVASTILALHGALAVISSPIIGHFADKSRDRKTPLLISLGFCIAGSWMIAAARSVPTIFIGRAMQGIAGSTVWIVGFATVTETVSTDNIGSAIGFTFSLASAGTICGPAFAGLLFEAIGYWGTWSVPLLILIIDLVARVIMLESPPDDSSSNSHNDTVEATTPLCPRTDQESSQDGSFWSFILHDSSILICLLLAIAGTAILNSFHSTLPQHVQETFGWGPRASGFLFAGLVAPGVVIGPFAGWTRDQLGPRLVIAIAAILQAIAFGLMGIAGNSGAPLSPEPTDQTKRKALYIFSILAIGSLRPFVAGTAAAELAAAGKASQEKGRDNSGPNGALLRVLSMLDAAASLGMAIGPVLGGALMELYGYKYMSWTWSILYVIFAIMSMCFLRPKGTHETLP